MLLMEGTELFHTGLHILRVFRIADTRTLQVFRNLIAVFRIDRHDFIADALSVQCPIYRRLLPAVDQKTRASPGILIIYRPPRQRNKNERFVIPFFRTSIPVISSPETESTRSISAIASDFS
mgnify:CR=1 FL=1